jgi:hypothetical protein
LQQPANISASREYLKNPPFRTLLIGQTIASLGDCEDGVGAHVEVGPPLAAPHREAVPGPECLQVGDPAVHDLIRSTVEHGEVEHLDDLPTREERANARRLLLEAAVRILEEEPGCAVETRECR